jgi:hypothetical protein
VAEIIEEAAHDPERQNNVNQDVPDSGHCGLSHMAKLGTFLPLAEFSNKLRRFA